MTVVAIAAMTRAGDDDDNKDDNNEHGAAMIMMILLVEAAIEATVLLTTCSFQADNKSDEKTHNVLEVFQLVMTRGFHDEFKFTVALRPQRP